MTGSDRDDDDSKSLDLADALNLDVNEEGAHSGMPAAADVPAPVNPTMQQPPEGWHSPGGGRPRGTTKFQEDMNLSGTVILSTPPLEAVTTTTLLEVGSGTPPSRSNSNNHSREKDDDEVKAAAQADRNAAAAVQQAPQGGAVTAALVRPGAVASKPGAFSVPRPPVDLKAIRSTSGGCVGGGAAPHPTGMRNHGGRGGGEGGRNNFHRVQGPTLNTNVAERYSSGELGMSSAAAQASGRGVNNNGSSTAATTKHRSREQLELEKASGDRVVMACASVSSAPAAVTQPGAVAVSPSSGAGMLYGQQMSAKEQREGGDYSPPQPKLSLNYHVAEDYDVSSDDMQAIKSSLAVDRNYMNQYDEKIKMANLSSELLKHSATSSAAAGTVGQQTANPMNIKPGAIPMYGTVSNLTFNNPMGTSELDILNDA